MRLGIGECQGRAPGAAGHDPAFKAEFCADHLQVRDQMRQRIVVAAALGRLRPAPRWSNRIAWKRSGRTIADDPAGSRCRARHADRPRECRPCGRRSRHRSRGRRDGKLFGGQRREGIGAVGSACIGVRRHRRPSPACRPRNCDRGNGCSRRPPQARPA